MVGPLDRYLYLAVRNGAFDRLEHAAVVQRWRKGRQADPEVLAYAKASAEEAIQAGELAATLERALLSGEPLGAAALLRLAPETEWVPFTPMS